MTYNLIRREIYSVVKKHNGPASHISFPAALQVVHAFLHCSSLQAASPEDFHKRLLARPKTALDVTTCTSPFLNIVATKDKAKDAQPLQEAAQARS